MYKADKQGTLGHILARRWDFKKGALNHLGKRYLHMRKKSAEICKCGGSDLTFG